MKYRNSVISNINNFVPPSEYSVMGALGLCGESGEVADLIKKHKFQGSDLDRTKLLKELGDVRGYMEVLCIAFNTSITEIEELNMKKLTTRYPEGFSVEANQLRRDENEK